MGKHSADNMNVRFIRETPNIINFVASKGDSYTNLNAVWHIQAFNEQLSMEHCVVSLINNSYCYQFSLFVIIHGSQCDFKIIKEELNNFLFTKSFKFE